MSYSLGWEGGAAAALLSLAALGLALLSWRLLLNKPRALRVLRGAALVVLALCLARITLEKLEARRVRPRVAVLVDTGLTMGASDGTGSSRLARAVAWLKHHRREISSRAEPMLFAGADRARRVSWEELDRLTPAAAGFDFGAALKSVEDSTLSEAGPPARLWLLSDGNSESGEDAGASAGRWAVPVDALGVGPTAAVRTVAVEELKVPDFVFLHSRFPVSATIEATELKGSVLAARLWKGSALVAERTLPVREAYEVIAATFTASAEALGGERYRLEVAARGGPAAKALREFGVEVIRQKHRIMYLAGRPSFEYANLREHLKANPNFELVSFVILRNPENAAAAPDYELSLIPFPAQEIFVQDLFQFDVFILENFAYWRFSLPVGYLDNLRRFVAQGGALLVIGGSSAYAQGGYRATPLEDVLPVALWSSPDDFVPGLFKPRLVSPGHPLVRLADAPDEAEGLWDALAPLDGFTRFSAVHAGSTVLLAHPSEKIPGGGPLPILAIREYGKGKVMVLGTDSTWRWRLGGGAQWKTASFYGRFWDRAIQYLSGTLDLQKVKFSPLPDRMPPREPATLTLHLFDESFKPLAGSEADLRVVWTAPGGRSRSVVPREKEPGIFEIELTGLAEGKHRVQAIARYRGQPWGEDRVGFIWEPRAPEAPLQRKWLEDVSQRTGGRYAALERAVLSERLAALPSVRTEREALRRWHLWDSSVWLWTILVLLVAEWVWRRRLGYV